MRQLTAKQKKLIRQWFLSEKMRVHDADDLTAEQWEILENINDTEILYQEVNSFISELIERL